MQWIFGYCFFLSESPFFILKFFISTISSPSTSSTTSTPSTSCSRWRGRGWWAWTPSGSSAHVFLNPGQEVGDTGIYSWISFQTTSSWSKTNYSNNYSTVISCTYRSNLEIWQIRTLCLFNPFRVGFFGSHQDRRDLGGGTQAFSKPLTNLPTHPLSPLLETSIHSVS